MASILLTGASGFIGAALWKRLFSDGFHKLTTVSRRPIVDMDSSIKMHVTDFVLQGSLRPILSGVDVVVHAAARAHITKESVDNPLAEFRKVNTDATLNLACQASEAGVRRFIFISSIGVNGTQNVQPFTEEDFPSPAEPYAISKLEAEEGLLKLAEETEMEVVIIRPPLVYGPNAPGNFGSLVRWVKKGFPIPFGAIKNLRSFVGLENLVDFIITCIDHPAAGNQTFLVADGEDVSTTDLIKRLGHALDKPARFIPIGPKLMALCAAMLGKKSRVEKLFGSLQVDISKAKTLLGWDPPMSLDEGLRFVAKGDLGLR
jgi:nucleoside-diphosphate-sugar epimerase